MNRLFDSVRLTSGGVPRFAPAEGLGCAVLLLGAAALLLSCGSNLASTTTSSSSSTASAATAYYVDCVAGSDTNSGTSSGAAWKSLSKVNATTFVAGDSILFARGTTCSGQLWPKGSGTSSAVITMADYGTGSLPVISGGTSQSAIKLYDQSYWEISNLETTGGSPYGIFVGGESASAVIHHIYLTNVVVHDVTGTPAQKASGLIVFHTTGTGESFDGVVVDGATAYSTTEWTGIYVDGATWSSPSGTKGSNITVRNSTVHDVGGDGIAIFTATGAVIEKSVAYNTGQTTVTSIGTSDAIWQWNCNTCTVQLNEAYLSHSPGTQDGGDFDSDYYNTNNTIQYNYGHDADGYCVSVFGAEAADTNSGTVIRYNVCSNNGQDSVKAAQGDFYFAAWSAGSILNAKVYNNTSSWNPVNTAAYAVTVVNLNTQNSPAVFDSAQADYFVNNIIYSAVAGMLSYPATGSGLTSDYNIFWRTASGTPQWQASGTSYTTLATWQSQAGQDAHSLFADPLLNSPAYHDAGRSTTAFKLQTGSPAIGAGWNLGSMGSQDFFGNALPSSGAVDIGAEQAP